MKPLYIEETSKGVYTIEDHGAGYHAIYFKTHRQKHPRIVGNGSSLERAKAGIELHKKYGTTRPDLRLDLPGVHRLAGHTTTLREAQAKLREIGITLKKTDGEYRVNPRGGSEETAYYTDDLEDAVGTGEAMAAHGKKSLGSHATPAHYATPGMRKHPLFIAYVQMALFSETDNATEQGGDPLDKNYDLKDIEESTLQEMMADCGAFIAKCNGKGLGDVIRNDEERAGHDFWLTRNGHGAGFWDGDWDDDGDALTEIAKSFGPYSLYVGDNGEIDGTRG